MRIKKRIALLILTATVKPDDGAIATKSCKMLAWWVWDGALGWACAGR